MTANWHTLLAGLALVVLCNDQRADAENNLPAGVVRVRDVNETRWFERTLDSDAVDWSLYPKAYGVLASERLMSPVDLSDWPVKVGSERQLFLDNFIVASAANVKRTVHQPVKHPDNPVMSPQEPWEVDNTLIVMHVLYDAQASKFRMWYTTRIRDPDGGRGPTLYAESSNGVNWQRPNLGLIEYKGSRENNVVWPDRIGLIHQPDCTDASRRFLGLMWPRDLPVAEQRGPYLYASPDGLQWKLVRAAPVVIFGDKDKTFPLKGIGDTSIIRWDSKLARYVCDTKLVHGQRGPRNDYGLSFRTRAVMTSDDLIHWTAPRMTIYPDALDGPDAQIYSNIGFSYESQWIGLLRMYHLDRTGYKQVDVQLTSSRDGLNWSRVGNREVFLPLGGDDSWERDYTDAAQNGTLLVDDQLWFFYRGSRHLIVKDDYTFALGLAKLRRDGFVSIDAGADKGILTTRPLTFPGKSLHVNAVAQAGSVKVGLADLGGKPIAGFGVEDCIALSGNGTDQVVRWKGQNDISVATTKAEHLRLQFELTSAELYSFWVE